MEVLSTYESFLQKLSYQKNCELIILCWKFQWKRNMIKLDPSKYHQEIYKKCHTEK